MKIIVLNYRNGCVELVPMDKTAITQHNMGEFNASAYLSDHGYPTEDCNWMVSDEEPTPVYYYGEMIPCVCI